MIKRKKIDIMTDDFLIKAGFMLLIAALIDWLLNWKDSFLNYGMALIAIYIINGWLEGLKRKPLNTSSIT